MDEPTPLHDRMLIEAETRARFRPADQSNATELTPEEHQALMADFGRALSAFARPTWRTTREMHQAAERAARADGA